MAVPTRAEAFAALLGTLFVATVPLAQGAAPDINTAGINISADLYDSSLRDDVHVLTGNVKITQAGMSMEAEKATVSGMQANHGRMDFERDVHIHSAQADLRADTADATFANGQITTATAKGSPARFEQLGTPAAKKTSGRAQIIEYDFAKGTVKLSQNVWFSYGGNEVRGDIVIYDLNNQRVVVNPGANATSGGRVNITIKPGSVPGLPGAPKKPDDKPEQGGNNE
jgi:lipopolysaccharide transport protein LptA